MSDSFTMQDAQNLIVHAQRAPLANLAEASTVSDLLRRFAAWANSQLGPQTPAPASTAPAGNVTPATASVPAGNVAPVVSANAKLVRAAIKRSSAPRVPVKPRLRPAP